MNKRRIRKFITHKHKLISFEEYATLEHLLGKRVRYVDVKIGNIAFCSIFIPKLNIVYTPHSNNTGTSFIDVLLRYQEKEDVL